MKERSGIEAELLVLGATPVAAQQITQVIVTTYNQGTNEQPMGSPQTLNFSSFNCGQKPKLPRPTQVQVNPTRVVFDDPADTTADCIFTDSFTANGPLFSLPFGTQPYETTSKFVSIGGTSPESARSNVFTHPGAPPAAPTGTRIVRLLLRGKTVFGSVGSRVFRRSPRPVLKGAIYLVGDSRGTK